MYSDTYSTSQFRISLKNIYIFFIQQECMFFMKGDSKTFTVLKKHLNK